MWCFQNGGESLANCDDTMLKIVHQACGQGLENSGKVMKLPVYGRRGKIIGNKRLTHKEGKLLFR